MSHPARWALGSFSLLFACTFAASVRNSPEPLFLWICAGFCLLIALACFSTVARGPSVRIIGAVVFALYAYYLAVEFPPAVRNPLDGRAHDRWLSALEGLITFGLPGLYVAMRGRFPAWSKFAPAFLGKAARENAEADRQISKLT